MLTALEWSDEGCSVLGCATRSGLQIDHRADWAATHETRLDQLDLLCAHHHQQKTHDGHRLAPGHGTRPFLPPAENDDTAHTAHTAVDHGPDPPSRHPVRRSTGPSQDPRWCAGPDAA